MLLRNIIRHLSPRLRHRKAWIPLILASLYVALILYSGSLMPMRVVHGTSMEPTLYEGDLVLVKREPFDSIEPGDVVAYRIPRNIQAEDFGLPDVVMHRVTDVKYKDGRTVLTSKGDNADVDPWPVTESEYQATHALRIPWIGLPLVFLTGLRGIVFVSMVFLVTLLYFPAVSIFYMLVIKRPDEMNALVRRDNADASYESTTPPLAQEIRTLSGSVAELSTAVAHVTRLSTDYQHLHNVVLNIQRTLEASQGGLGGVSVQGNAAFNVLIVDDQMISREQVRGVLEGSEGFKIVGEAADAAQALNMLDQVKPDLVLMDVNMPEINGFEATEQIQQRYPGTKIALFSGSNDNDYMERSLESGATVFIPKDQISANGIREAAFQSAGEKNSTESRNNSTRQDAAGVIDWDATVKSFGGNEDRAVRIAKIYVSDIPQIEQSIAEAVERSDFEAAFEAAHKLKNSLNVFGASAVAATARELEKSALAKDIETMRSLWPWLKADSERALEEIKARI